MNPKPRGLSLTFKRIIVTVMALAGVAGWGTYIHSSRTNAELEEQFRAQSAALQDYQAKFAAQRQKTEESSGQIEALRKELSVARSEIQRIKAEAEAELAKVREQAASAPQRELSLSAGVAPEVLRIKPMPTKQDVIAAQEALTQLRFGELKADGVIGASTRQAIEDFQRAAGLEVTGELQAQTLLALTRAARVMAAQAEKPE